MEESGAMKAALEAFRRLYENRESATLEIACGKKIFKVHEDVVRHSKYFKAVFFGGFREARTQRVSLPEDPFLVSRLIRGLYLHEHPDCAIKARPTPTADSEPAPSYIDLGIDDPLFRMMAVADELGTDEPTWISCAHTNVQMYALADKYDVPFLRQVALKNIQFAIDDAEKYRSVRHQIEAELLGAIPLLYSTTLDTDRPLRDVLLEYVKTHWVRLSTTEELLDAFAQAPVFAVEMVTAANPKTPYEGKRRRWCCTCDKWTELCLRCICGSAEAVTGNDGRMEWENVTDGFS